MLLLKRLLAQGNGRKASGIASKLVTGIAAVGLLACQNPEPTVDTTQAIVSAVNAPQRRADWVERDPYRHPVETLAFFQVEPHHTVVEIWPGGGWYTEVLAPLLNDTGTYYAAHFSAGVNNAYVRKSLAAYKEKLASDPVYNQVKLTQLNPPADVKIAPSGSADRVLTFRNVHNWMKFNTDESAFGAFYEALKPGGYLGVVEHRAKAGTPLQTMIDSGYVTEAKVKALAKAAGFEFVAASEVNANAKDTTNHPKGVWTLPPSYRLGEENKAFYTDIGESDRMTLLFRKPNG